MRHLMIAVVAVLSIVADAAAIEIKLDDAWMPKLGQLCDAARYGSRMLAEPICAELGGLVAAAQAEARTKAKSDLPNDPAKPSSPTDPQK